MYQMFLVFHHNFRSFIKPGSPGFLKLFLCVHLYMHDCMSMCVCVCVCVCVSPPTRILILGCVMWHDMDPI